MITSLVRFYFLFYHLMFYSLRINKKSKTVYLMTVQKMTNIKKCGFNEIKYLLVFINIKYTLLYY